MDTTEPVQLTPGEADDLLPVRCGLDHKPWTLEAEDIARIVATEGMRRDPRITVLAFVEDHQIKSLIAYRPLIQLPSWEILILATDRDAQDEGLGEELFVEVARRAREAGIGKLWGYVHPLNDPMLGLIEKMRGSAVATDESPSHLIFSMSVAR